MEIYVLVRYELETGCRRSVIQWGKALTKIGTAEVLALIPTDRDA